MNRLLYILISLPLLLCSCSSISLADFNTEPIKYTLFLSTQTTRTVNDGISTRWVLGDRVQVLFAETGTSNYQQGIDFKITDVESGRIEGTLPEEFDPDLIYDWYISYPNSGTASPKRDMTIGVWGSEHFAIQTGNNSMAHLAGPYHYPIVGNVKGIPGVKSPSVKMQNVAAVIAFNVRNSTEEDLTIQDIQLKAPELINGKYEVDFSGEEVLVTPNKKESIARLEVQEGTPIKPGETAKFHMGVKPFSYENGDELICVPSAIFQGETLACRIAKVMDTPIHFGQGTITTVNLDFAPSTAPLEVNSADFKTFNQGFGSGFNENLISLDGWKTQNCAAKVKKTEEKMALHLSGNSNNPGILTSPLLANGCGILSFKYTFIDSSPVSFRVDVLDEKDNTLWTKTIDESAPVFGKVCDFSESVNVSGPFRLKFTNLCVSGATWHTDRVSLYDMTWTNME